MNPEEAGLISAVTPVLIDHESERLKVYKDSVGLRTIGVGLALEQLGAWGPTPSRYAQGICTALGLNYNGLIAGTEELTKEQSRNILSRCIIDVVEWLTQVFPDFWTYSVSRQIALTDMGFNLGESKFRGFHQTISCILAAEWADAASSALHSHWASQVPGRAASDAERLRQG
jgi:GH24 family phage-related lysozyme (muramidase)